MIDSRALRRGVLLAACACAVGSGVEAQDLRGTVEGVVLSQESDRPVADAMVGIFGGGQHVSSDSAGRFRLTEVRFGSQQVEVRAIGYQPSAHAVTVVPGEVTRIELRLKPAVVNLPEVVVSTSREEQLASSTAASVGVIQGEEIRETRGPSPLGDREPHRPVSTSATSAARGTPPRSVSRSPPRRSTPTWKTACRSAPPASSITTRSTRSTFRRPAGSKCCKGPGTARVRQRCGGRRGERLHVAIRRPRPRRRSSSRAAAAPICAGSARRARPSGAAGFRADLNVTRADGWRDQTPLRAAERLPPLGLRAERAQPAQDAGDLLSHRPTRRRWRRHHGRGFRSPPRPAPTRRSRFDG